MLVLKRAAARASEAPDVIPRPDQFYYVAKDGYQEWLSMDGTHDGEARMPDGTRIAMPGCHSTTRVISPSNGPEPCTLDPAYDADAPTTVAAMTSYLNRKFGMAGSNGIAKGAYDLLRDHYLRPAARATVFAALTRIPHLTSIAVNPSTVGLTWSVSGVDNEPDVGQSRASLLFDRTTYAFVGLTTIGLHGEPGGSLSPSTVAIVDRIGEHP